VLTVLKAGLLTEAQRADLCAEIQEAIVTVLVAKAMAAVEGCGLDQLVVAGGVGANRRLRERLNAAAAEAGVRVYYPEVELCTDNGAMIAFAGALRLAAGKVPPRDGAAGGFAVRPRWPLQCLDEMG
jgi:N6-L-threonylcarbamoyladenine synthase